MKFGKNAFAIFDKVLSTCCKIRIRAGVAIFNKTVLKDSGKFGTEVVRLK